MIFSKSGLDTKDLKEQKELDLIWANKIKERDGWACVICGSKYAPNAHHLIPRENKETRHNIENGITLCTKHHKFSRVISAHNNPLAFYMWLEKYKFHEFCIARLKTAELCKGECNL